MGLFSNLFGSNGKDIDDAFKQMKNLAGDIIDDGQFNNSQNKPNPAPTSPAAPSYNASVQVFEEGPSGDSWGPNMPAEENQFNSGLRYQDYFNKVFTEGFPSYQIEKEDVRNGSAMLFTFSQAGSKKLVVEVISRKSSPYKVRNDCRKQGVAYLRYYYDYDGWWNTKSYVIRRTSKALGIG